MVWFWNQVVAPTFVIGVLVFVHELGHFLVAKLCGVGVVKFSVGFGPALFRFRRKETVYQLSIIPLGGFVRMVGDMPDVITGAQLTDELVRESGSASAEGIPRELEAVVNDRRRWFIEKNFWKRSAIVIAGPLFNFVFAYFLVFAAVLMYGEEWVDESARIGTVSPNSPAERAGIQVGDLVKSLNGTPVGSWNELAETMHGSGGNEVEVVLERGGREERLTVTPQRREIPTFTGEMRSAYIVGVGPTVLNRDAGVVDAATLGAYWTADKTLLTYWGLWGMVTGKVSAEDLAGPLFIIDTAGKQAEKGFDNLLYFMALLSVSLAVLNLLPIPILDGGHLLFFVVEALLGPISIRKKELAQSVGMLLLLGLMVFALRNDIVRDTAKMEQGIQWDNEGGKKVPGVAEGEGSSAVDRSANERSGRGGRGDAEGGGIRDDSERAGSPDRPVPAQ